MRNRDLLQTRLRAVKIALEGLAVVLKTQLNARIHAVFTLAVFILAGFLRISRVEWMILLLTVGLVWAAEIFNTAVETAVDKISPDVDPQAKIIKDISAGAVLISVFTSILVGLMLFGPPLWDWIKQLFL